jgi:hypothetical protein
MHHILKIDLTHYENVLTGDKTFEVRFNDRGYQKGDTFTLNVNTNTRLYVADKKPLNGTITYVTRFQQKDGWVVFGFKLI